MGAILLVNNNKVLSTTMRKSKNIKNYKNLTKIIVIVLVVILIAGGLIAGLDYSKYSSHQQSQFFGSKDVYAQDQSLYFDDIKVTVSEVEHMNYSYQTYETCSKISEQAGALMRANDFVKTADWEIKSMHSSHCLELAELYNNKKMVVIHYFVENLQDRPLDISEYSITAHGDEKADSTEPEQKSKTLLASQSQYNAFVIHHVDIKNNGPFALLVSRNGKQKQIQLTLPNIKPFCDSDACQKETYDGSE